MKTSEDSFDDVRDNEALLGEGESRQQSRSSQCTRTSVLLWSSLSTVVGLVVGLVIGYSLLRPSYNSYVRQTTQSSEYHQRSRGSANETAPLLNDVNIQYSSIPFNGSFMKENIYRLKGAPEVDAAWEALGVNCWSHF